jgi:L-threonylcarbamoyladenylate synthase
VTYISPFRIRLATKQLRQGAVLAYPTEAVYGLGCDPLNEDAAMRLLQLKHRPVAKGLILVAANLQQLEPFLRLDKAIVARCSATWPGPVTWVVPVQDWVPKWLTGEHQSLAVRVSAHPCVQALCTAFGGALVSTSANPGGKTPALNALQTQIYFPRGVSLFSGDTGGLKSTSAIFDAVTGRRFR